MLNQLLGKNSESVQISKERLMEIFEVPKTKEIWEQFIQNRKFKKMIIDSAERIQNILENTLTIEEIKESNIFQSKLTILQHALFLVANEGVSLNKAIQKSCKNYLKDIEAMSEEEIDETMIIFFNDLYEQVKYRNQQIMTVIYADIIM